MYVIMSTRENIRLIARTPSYSRSYTFAVLRAQCKVSLINPMGVQYLCESKSACVSIYIVSPNVPFLGVSLCKLHYRVCLRAAKALARQRACAGLPEFLLLSYCDKYSTTSGFSPESDLMYQQSQMTRKRAYFSTGNSRK